MFGFSKLHSGRRFKFIRGFKEFVALISWERVMEELDQIDVFRGDIKLGILNAGSRKSELHILGHQAAQLPVSVVGI